MMATQERMDGNTKGMQEKMERQISPLLSLIEADRRTGRDEMKQIRAGQEHMQEIDNQKQSRKDRGRNTIHTVREGVENVMMRVIHETQSLQKACLETTTCHEVTETDAEKIQPDPRMMQSVGIIKRSPRKKPQ
jgi:hypothetical protein